MRGLSLAVISALTASTAAFAIANVARPAPLLATLGRPVVAAPAQTDRLKPAPVMLFGREEPPVLALRSSLFALGWLSWWTQAILSTVSTVTFLFANSVSGCDSRQYSNHLFFCLAHTRPLLLVLLLLPHLTRFCSCACATRCDFSRHMCAPVRSNLTPLTFAGRALAITGLACALASTLWTLSYARLGRRLGRKPETLASEASDSAMGIAKFGVTLNLVGMAMCILSAFAITGTLAAKSLTMSQAATLGVAASPVQAIDILVVQANTNTLAAHFASLCSCLRLRRRAEVCAAAGAKA